MDVEHFWNQILHTNTLQVKQLHTTSKTQDVFLHVKLFTVKRLTALSQMAAYNKASYK